MLGALTNEEIIKKVSETPQRIKYNLKRIRERLEKIGVTLNKNNEVIQSSRWNFQVILTKEI